MILVCLEKNIGRTWPGILGGRTSLSIRTAWVFDCSRNRMHILCGRCVLELRTAFRMWFVFMEYFLLEHAGIDRWKLVNNAGSTWIWCNWVKTDVCRYYSCILLVLSCRMLESYFYVLWRPLTRSSPIYLLTCSRLTPVNQVHSDLSPSSLRTRKRLRSKH